MNILQMSLAASVLILLIAVVRYFFKNRIPKYVLNLLWGIACLRLMIPDSAFAPIARLLRERQTETAETIPGIFQLPAGVYRTVEAVSGGFGRHCRRRIGPLSDNGKGAIGCVGRSVCGCPTRLYRR